MVLQLALVSHVCGHAVIVSLIPKFYDFDNDKQIYAKKERLNDVCAMLLLLLFTEVNRNWPFPNSLY